MRRLFTVLVISFFVLALVAAISGVSIKIHSIRKLNARISHLPNFSFVRLDTGLYRSSEIREGPVLIIHFHPECEHCRYELTELQKSEIPESGAVIVLISGAGRDSVEAFFRRIRFEPVHPFTVLADTANVFGEIFGNEVIPCNIIYDRSLHLVKILNGEVKSETLIKYLK